MEKLSVVDNTICFFCVLQEKKWVGVKGVKYTLLAKPYVALGFRGNIAAKNFFVAWDK